MQSHDAAIKYWFEDRPNLTDWIQSVGALSSLNSLGLSDKVMIKWIWWRIIEELTQTNDLIQRTSTAAPLSFKFKLQFQFSIFNFYINKQKYLSLNLHNCDMIKYKKIHKWLIQLKNKTIKQLKINIWYQIAYKLHLIMSTCFCAKHLWCFHHFINQLCNLTFCLVNLHLINSII